MTQQAAPKFYADADSDDLVAFVTHRIGADVALTIQRAYGGRRVTIPIDPQPYHAFVKLVGLKHTQLIVKEFGFGDLVLPLGEISRRGQIEQACIDGGTITAIARAFGCCTRTVSKTRARLRRQGRMA